MKSIRVVIRTRFNFEFTGVLVNPMLVDTSGDAAAGWHFIDDDSPENVTVVPREEVQSIELLDMAKSAEPVRFEDEEANAKNGNDGPGNTEPASRSGDNVEPDKA